MAQVRYTNSDAALAKARTLANKHMDRDVDVVVTKRSNLRTPGSVIVIEAGARSWAVLLSDGNGSWAEQ